MVFPQVLHHGAINGVTGSCHQLLMSADRSLLVDCGAFQGRDAQSRSAVLDFDIAGICALLITHVHIDHVGRIPQLLAAGFLGPIICSEASAHLLPIVLEDALRLAVTRDARQIARFKARLESLIVALDYARWHTLVDSTALHCKVRLQRAGHVLGSAYIECEVADPQRAESRRIVFSGDLGVGDSPFLRAPQPPARADLLVLESTYGDRLHPPRDTRQARLLAVIEAALANQGTILVPAFSIGRTQELLYEIEDILHAKALLPTMSKARSVSHVDWPTLPIILDSPLAGRFTQAYRQLQHLWNEEGQARMAQGRRPLAFEQLITVQSHIDHERTVNYLASTGRPAIVIAGSGMCNSGRIVNYLKKMLGGARHCVVFTGYQAPDTPGARIQASQGKAGIAHVELGGQDYAVHADIRTLGGYSAHADQRGLVDFVKGIEQWPEEIRLVHGEARAKRALRARLDREESRNVASQSSADGR